MIKNTKLVSKKNNLVKLFLKVLARIEKLD